MIPGEAAQNPAHPREIDEFTSQLASVVIAWSKISHAQRRQIMGIINRATVE